MNAFLTPTRLKLIAGLSKNESLAPKVARERKHKRFGCRAALRRSEGAGPLGAALRGVDRGHSVRGDGGCLRQVSAQHAHALRAQPVFPVGRAHLRFSAHFSHQKPSVAYRHPADLCLFHQRETVPRTTSVSREKELECDTSLTGYLTSKANLQLYVMYTGVLHVHFADATHIC